MELRQLRGDGRSSRGVMTDDTNQDAEMTSKVDHMA